MKEEGRSRRPAGLAERENFHDQLFTKRRRIYAPPIKKIAAIGQRKKPREKQFPAMPKDTEITPRNQVQQARRFEPKL
jgi:hypothetical protein